MYCDKDVVFRIDALSKLLHIIQNSSFDKYQIELLIMVMIKEAENELKKMRNM